MSFKEIQEKIRNENYKKLKELNPRLYYKTIKISESLIANIKHKEENYEYDIEATFVAFALDLIERKI
jgi:hypothetical protein